MTKTKGDLFFNEKDEKLYQATKTGLNQFSWRDLTQALQKQLERFKK